MVQTENAEWEEFSALLDDVVPDTSDAAQHSQPDASYDSQTDAQAQDELQSASTDEDDSDLDEVDVDKFAMKSEMEAESRTTTRPNDPTLEAPATGPVMAEVSFEISASGSSSTATTRSMDPQSEAAANRERATQRGYLARKRAARKSASSKKAQKEAASQAGSEIPRAPSTGEGVTAPRVPSPATTFAGATPAAAVAHTVSLPRPQTGSRKSNAPAPTSVPTPSASSSTSLARPAQSSSRTATSVATLPPPPPLPVGPTGRRQLWEETLTLGLPRVKAEYRVTLPPARPASAPVVGAASAGPVSSVGARHQSAPVASSSRGKRSRDAEDRGNDVVQKRTKVNTAQSRKRVQALARSPSGSTPRPQWIPYAAQQTEPSRLLGSAPAAQPNAARDQQLKAHHQRVKPVPQLARPRRAGPSTETSQETNGTPMNRAGREGSVPSTMRLPPPPTLQRPQVTPGAGPSYHTDERTSAQTYARPVMPSWSDPSSVPRTFSRAVLSASEQRQPVVPEAGPSRRAYEQQYNDAGLQRAYNQATSAQAYTMPVPSGWNDPAAVPRTFTRAGLSGSTMQPEGQSIYRGVQDAPVAYAAPQQQIGRPVPPIAMYGGRIAPGAETGSQAVYDQPYAPPMPLPAGWNIAQLQAMSGGERVPDYLTMYAPPNHPPPGWNPQAPVYRPEPSARGQGSMSNAYGYGYDF